MSANETCVKFDWNLDSFRIAIEVLQERFGTEEKVEHERDYIGHRALCQGEHFPLPSDRETLDILTNNYEVMYRIGRFHSEHDRTELDILRRIEEEYIKSEAKRRGI